MAIVAAIAAAAALLAFLSYRQHGIVYVFASALEGGAVTQAAVREWVLGWGALAPLAYVAAVIVEVLIAPIPGTLLYAPAGAIFGGGWGGTLSLAGNVAGATIACALARVLGTRLTAKLDASTFAPAAGRLRRHGVWVIALLRVNPLTSSDLVSYAAGVARVPIWHVTAGTCLGMAPLCYAQSYLAQEVFSVVPGAGVILVACAVLYAVIVLAMLLRG